MSKIITQEVIETVNTLGEVKEAKTTKVYHIPSEENYVKIYLKDIDVITSLPNGLDKLLNELFKIVDYNNIITLNSTIKKQIACNLNKKPTTINQYMYKLENKGVLNKKDTNIYYLNPYYFGKGKWSDIVKLRSETDS